MMSYAQNVPRNVPHLCQDAATLMHSACHAFGRGGTRQHRLATFHAYQCHIDVHICTTVALHMRIPCPHRTAKALVC